MKVAILVHDGFEDLEYFVPKYALIMNGFNVLTVGMRMKKECKGRWGLAAEVDVLATEICPEELSGILIPGGYAPDKIRRFPPVLKLVKAIDEAKKPLGLICHAGSVAISAKILNKGDKCTSSYGIKDDLINAGAEWIDKSVVIDGNRIWAQGVKSLAEYTNSALNILKQGK